jgi:hypothetical protein
MTKWFAQLHAGHRGYSVPASRLKSVELRPEFPSGGLYYPVGATTRRRGTTLHLERRNLNLRTALGIASGVDGFPGRSEAQLSRRPILDWMGRLEQVASQYPPPGARGDAQDAGQGGITVVPKAAYVANTHLWVGPSPTLFLSSSIDGSQCSFIIQLY